MKPSFAISKLKALFSWERAAVAVLLLLGALLRVRQYLAGRSLWVDEAMLALNIVNRNFAEMFQPLDYDQGSPIGFLLVEKIFNSILGKNEFALRLFSLLVGLLSLWLFYLLSKRIATKAGLFTALALFAFNPRLVYYSSEVKQYIADVVVTISLLLIAAPVFNMSPRKKDFAWLMLAGLIALWFSHPALFVLTGIGLALVIVTLKRLCTTAPLERSGLVRYSHRSKYQPTVWDSVRCLFCFCLDASRLDCIVIQSSELCNYLCLRLINYTNCFCFAALSRL